MSDELPKRRKTPSLKKNKSVKTDINEDIQDQDILNVKHLINELLTQRTRQVATQRSVEDTNNALINTISEFLKCFMILGYTNEGTPIAITKSNDHLEKDALQTLLHKFFTINMIKTQDGLMGELE